MYKLDIFNSGESLVAVIDFKDLQCKPTHLWCPSPSFRHRTTPYKLPKNIRVGSRDTEESSSRFTPPPLAVVVQNGKQKILVAVKAKPGWHHFNFVDFKISKNKMRVIIDLEGHSDPEKTKKHINVYAITSTDKESNLELLSRGMKQLYPESYVDNKKNIPDWWKLPIYCGWGDQVAASIAMEGPGAESRAIVYCTQGLYKRWIERLEFAGIPINTITIDNGWSLGGVWSPIKSKWPDLGAFVNSQHQKNRKVLLWLATWLTEGVPDQWCARIGKTTLVVDPSNSKYRKFLIDHIRHLLSSKNGGINADGFKIDQLGYTPYEREPQGGENFGRTFSLKSNNKIQIAGEKWGLELLYDLQKLIYDTAKSVKADALISSSTVHPYFHDTFDMVRLHDTGYLCKDILQAMRVRADLARAVFPNAIIDADNWVHSNYQKWLDYTLKSHTIGVNSLFYAERFPVFSIKKNLAIKQVPIAIKDLRTIGKLWTQLY